VRLPPEPIPGITELPPSAPGMRIGLFGGSFNPPHAGHRLVALQAMKRLGLDAVWLLVSPGNPLKSHRELAPLAHRVHQTRNLLRHPRIRVTGVEAAQGFRYTFDTLDFLGRRLPGRHLVWIMGADNLATFHRWDRWREIASLMPMAVYVRPSSGAGALVSPAAETLARHRLDEADARLLPTLHPPAWVFLHGEVSPLSSTALRSANRR